MDKVALAVPGERYLRLLEAVRSDNPAEQKKAREQVRRLFSVDFEQPYQVSIWWEKPAGAPLHLNYFLSSLADEKVVRAQCEFVWNPLDATSTATPPPNVEELRKLIGRRTQKALDVLGEQGPFPVEVHEYSGSEKYLKKKQAQDQAGRRREAAEQIRDAILAAFPQPTAQLATSKRTLPFSLIEGQSLLYILVEEQDLKPLTDKDFRVSALLHAKGSPAVAFEDRWEVFASKDSFYGDHKVVTCGNTGKKVRWAVLNLTQGPTITAEALASLKKLKEIFDEFDKK